MKLPSASVLGAIVLSALAAGAITFVGACAGSPDGSRVTQVYSPDYPTFVGNPADPTVSGPSLFLERRCGTLDCHGQVGRPLRIFGQRGLRLVDDAGNIPGGNATTDDEHFANFLAVIGVEPEITSVVVAEGGDGPERLLLLKKPLGLERHKGGQIMVATDDGYTCLTSWLAGATAFQACTNAAAVP